MDTAVSNTLMTGLDIVCLLFVLVVLYGTIAETRMEKMKNRLFAFCVAGVAFILLVDCLTNVLDGKGMPYAVMFILNLLSFVLGQPLAAGFSYYLVTLLREKSDTSWIYAHLVLVWSAAVTCVILVISGTGLLFTMENDIFTPGPLYSPVCALAVVPLVYQALLVISKRNVLGIHDSIAVFVYTMIPLITGLIEAFYDALPLTYVGVSLGIMLTYVMVQSGETAEARLHAKLMAEVSRTDALTGLPNRRGFDSAMETMPDMASCGAVFCDLNGLKTTNDTLGHAAGDRLICDFAALLRRHFRSEEIFRISGDEFVVLMRNVDEITFYKRADELKREITRTRISAMGTAYGTGSQAAELVQAAEGRMYTDKKTYYEETGIDRRRS